MVSAVSDVDSEDIETVVDFRGRPFDKSSTGGWLAAGLILAKFATIVTNFMGSLNLLALLAGFLADAKFGRYLTVAIFVTITAVGATLLTVATSIPSMRPPACDEVRRQHHECIQATGNQLPLLYTALYVIALGGGGIKSNVSGFGSDQFDGKDPMSVHNGRSKRRTISKFKRKAMFFFFNRFYFCISLGSLFAVTVLVYIQDNVGRAWGYGISAGAMAIAVLVLFGGTPVYRLRKCLDKEAIVDASDNGQLENGAYNSWVVSTVTQVEEVKIVLKLIPIWSTCILFWTVYSQMTTLSVEQATFMNRHIGSFVFPSGSVSKVIVPIARRFTHTTQGITSLQRIGIGLLFGIMAMVASAIVEKQRKIIAVRDQIQISVFWLVPQYFLVGAGEGFAYVGQLEFFIREALERMKSMSTGLFLTSMAMGFFVSSFLVSLVDRVTHKGWIRSNINKAKLDYFFWMLAVLGVLNFLVFLVFEMKHQYKVEKLNDKTLEGDNENELKDWKIMGVF
ncbi:hypothetical protein MKX01_032718 [Papaver californicum]|nr:hypothetical protein MKX01_032718 [Papaver californicum]